MNDRGMTAAERRQVDTLVQALLGADPVVCGEAHAKLLALGGFDRDEVRDSLERQLRQPAATQRRADPSQAPGLPAHGLARVVGTFELGRWVGQGGLGTVYEARDLSGAIELEYLCIKLSEPASPAGATSLASAGRLCAQLWEGGSGAWQSVPVSAERSGAVLEAEHRFLSSVESDLFPAVVAAGVWDGIGFYAMERLRGDDLRQHLVTGSAHCLEYRRLFRRLLRELAALRARDDRFFHGDIKPENVLVTPGRLRLLDPAWRDDRGNATTSTVAYNPLGRTGEAADTGALALVMLEVMTGLQPFVRRLRPWRAGDGPVDAALLPLQVFAAHAAREPLVAQLVQCVKDPLDYASFAALLGR